MKNWLAVAVVGVGCLVGGWFLGRVKGDSSEGGEFAVPRTPESAPVLMRRAQQLQKIDANANDGRQVLRFLRYLAENLNDDSWWAVSSAIWRALDQHRNIDALQDGVFLANAQVLPRFIQAGCLDEVGWLIQRGNTGAFDAGQINLVLEKAAALPLPPAGFPQSAQEMLVSAAIRVGDYARAKDYLSKIPLSKEGPAETARRVEAAKVVVDLGLQAAAGKLDLARLIAAWRGQSAEPLGKSCVQPALENIVLSAFTELDRKVLLPSVERLFAGSSSEEGAELFWQRILFRMQQLLVRGPELLSLETAGLVDAFCKQYHRADYGYEYWMRLVELTWRWTSDNPGRAAGFCRRALAAATSDRDRVNALRHLAFHSERAIDPESALRTVEESGAAVKDPALKKELTQVADELRLSAAKAKNSPTLKKWVDEERQQKIVRRTRDLLLQARKDNRPAGEIASLQELLRDLESQLRE